MFIIRSQGFFYTDEYYATGDTFKQVIKTTYETKAAATKACSALIRTWVRSEPIGNYVFDDDDAIEAIVAYFREQWPEEHGESSWDFELTIPEEATDKQVDEIVKRMDVTFAQVFEVDGDDAEKVEGDEGDDDDDDDDDDDEAYSDDDLHYGPTKLSRK
jgi:hypothetical protein